MRLRAGAKPDYEFAKFVSATNTTVHPECHVRTGDHVACMVQESLIGHYRKYRDNPLLPFATVQIANNQLRGMLCSFWDTLPERIKQYSDTVLVRSETVILRCIGNSKLPVISQKGDLEVSRAHLRDIHALVQKFPNNIIYRMLDYLTDDFAFLNSKLPNTVRGAQRLLEEPYLLRRELGVISSCLESGKQMTILVPYCTDKQQYHELYNQLRKAFGNNIRIGISIENKYSIDRLEDFAGAEAMLLAPSDLKASLIQEKRSTVDVTKGNELVINAVRDAISRFENSSVQDKALELFACKVLVDQIASERFKVRTLYTPDQLVMTEQERNRVQLLYT